MSASAKCAHVECTSALHRRAQYLRTAFVCETHLANRHPTNPPSLARLTGLVPHLPLSHKPPPARSLGPSPALFATACADLAFPASLSHRRLDAVFDRRADVLLL
jgi:hypothetical protein